MFYCYLRYNILHYYNHYSQSMSTGKHLILFSNARKEKKKKPHSFPNYCTFLTKIYCFTSSVNSDCFAVKRKLPRLPLLPLYMVQSFSTAKYLSTCE